MFLIENTGFLNEKHYFLLRKLVSHNNVEFQDEKHILLLKPQSFLKKQCFSYWPGPGWGPVRVGARSGLEPIRALMGPYGPLWAHM